MSLRLSPEPIEPIVKVRPIPLDPDRAFELYTTGMGRWWPLATHSISGAEASVRVDGWVGGRVVEIAEDGTEYAWADILAWDPPHRLVLSWHPSVDPVAASTVEIRFEPADGGCTLRIEHRGWEELGAGPGREARANYDPGWDHVLAPYEAAAATASAPAAD